MKTADELIDIIVPLRLRLPAAKAARMLPPRAFTPVESAVLVELFDLCAQGEPLVEKDRA